MPAEPQLDRANKEARIVDLSTPGPVILPPDSVRFKSRVVELAPGDSVGLHVTHQREEIVVVLEGNGELRLPNADGDQEAGASKAGLGGEGRVLALSAGQAAYVPPETLHDIHNTGDAPLRYIYIVTLLE